MKLGENEEVLHELGPQNRIPVVWFFTKVLGWSLIGGFVAFWLTGMTLGLIGAVGEIETPRAFKSMGLWSAGVFATAFFLSTLYAYFLRGTFKYYITTQRCVFVGGILRYRERSIPYHKITDVELSRNILERILGISSIRIFTPGTSSNFSWGPFGGGQNPELKYEGLEESEEPTESINLLVRDSKDAIHT